jgi:hypothetical protein
MLERKINLASKLASKKELAEKREDTHISISTQYCIEISSNAGATSKLTGEKCMKKHTYDGFLAQIHLIAKSLVKTGTQY